MRSLLLEGQGLSSLYHEYIFNDVYKRIREIREHHNKRLEEILTILKDKELDAYQIASKIEWKLNTTWELADPFQKYLAIGETLSHIIYLEKEGLIEKSLRPDGRIILKENMQPIIDSFKTNLSIGVSFLHFNF